MRGVRRRRRRSNLKSRLLHPCGVRNDKQATYLTIMIECTNIHKIYDNGADALRVLKGISLEVKKNEFCAIIGPSGAGKSTLLHILAGLDYPTQGKVVLDNTELSFLKEKQLCRLRNEKIGFVFQFYHLLPEFTVLENVLMPVLISRQLSAISSQLKAKKILKQLGLAERLNHFPSQLSGGEKQRVAIARALINSPEILFCDEPTGNLDSATGNEIMDLIHKIRKENKMTVILVTHNLELAKPADKVFHLRDGALVN